MNDSEKRIAVILLVIWGILVVGIIGLHLNAIQKEKVVLAYNSNYENDFYDYLEDEGLEIVSERRYINEVIYDWHGVTVSDSETEVFEDEYKAYYHHEFELYDTLTGETVLEELSHAPEEELHLNVDSISRYREESKAYYDNFELIRGIIESHGGTAECINEYDPAYERNYFLLIYLPDATAMIEANRDLYDNIYGGYVYEHVHNGIKVTIPRFIFCSDQDTYVHMKFNIDAARQYISGKSYECENSVLIREEVDLERVCNLLLGRMQENYSVTHVSGANTLGSTVCREHLLSITSSDFIALHELGETYHLTIYESR